MLFFGVVPRVAPGELSKGKVIGVLLNLNGMIMHQLAERTNDTQLLQ